MQFRRLLARRGIQAGGSESGISRRLRAADSYRARRRGAVIEAAGTPDVMAKGAQDRIETLFAAGMAARCVKQLLLGAEMRNMFS